MPLAGLPMFDMLKTRMQWHQARQRVLSENVAGADMPGFKPRDLRQPDFDGAARSPGPVSLVSTQGGHLPGFLSASSAGTTKSGSFETSPSGNSVQLEDEMMKVAQNQMDYQMATSLYAKSLQIMKTAIRRG